jgi:hypothetical protein
MSRPVSPGIIALILLAGAGAWLVAAPFVLAAFGVRDLVSAAAEAVAEETEPELSPTEQTGYIEVYTG